MKESQSVLKGSVLLIASAILAKILGAVFRIPLTLMLGGTGMGYNLQHYKDIIVTPTAYGQGLTFLMLTELMTRDSRPD